MSKLELIRHLYEYNEWANSKLLDAASRVPAEQLLDAQVASWGSVVVDLAHIAAAQVAWLHRWREGENPASTALLQSVDTLAAVRDLFERSHQGLRGYIPTLTDQQLDGALRYRDSRGNENERPLWQLMMHVANHGTYHRGEIAGVFTNLGHSPGDVDFVFWELGLR